MRTLIVGTGRSGTQWITDTLNSNGITASHQLIRHAHTLGEPVVWPQEIEVIVSFEAVPLLSRLSCRKFLVVRNPNDVICSWVKMGAFADNMRSEFALWAVVLDRYFPAVLEEGTAHDRAAHYWLIWNTHASMFVEDVVRLDQIQTLAAYRNRVQWHPPPVSSYQLVSIRSGLADACWRFWKALA